jgi:hypothetical protein
MPEDHRERVLWRLGRAAVHGDTVVALNSWTFSARCAGPNLEYRVDSPAAQEFLETYL